MQTAQKSLHDLPRPQLQVAPTQGGGRGGRVRGRGARGPRVTASPPRGGGAEAGVEHRYGPYGGQYVPETLMPALQELEDREEAKGEPGEIGPGCDA